MTRWSPIRYLPSPENLPFGAGPGSRLHLAQGAGRQEHVCSRGWDLLAHPEKPYRLLSLFRG
jgi:hypothetical protein